MATQKPKKTTRKAKAFDVAGGPLVDKALKARWDEALARLRAAKESETRDWDAQYEALGDILDGDPPFYLAAGYKTARAFLAAELAGVDERTARRNVRVARYFDPEDEAAHGIAKLEALLGYLEAAGGAPLAPAKIHLARQKVRLASGKRSQLVSFAEATKEQILTAARTARSGKPGGKGAAKEPPLVKAVRAALTKAKLGMVSVALRAGWLALGEIPPDKLGALGKVLARLKLAP